MSILIMYNIHEYSFIHYTFFIRLKRYPRFLLFYKTVIFPNQAYLHIYSSISYPSIYMVSVTGIFINPISQTKLHLHNLPIRFFSPLLLYPHSHMVILFPLVSPNFRLQVHRNGKTMPPLTVGKYCRKFKEKPFAVKHYRAHLLLLFFQVVEFIKITSCKKETF